MGLPKSLFKNTMKLVTTISIDVSHTDIRSLITKATEIHSTYHG